MTALVSDAGGIHNLPDIKDSTGQAVHKDVPESPTVRDRRRRQANNQTDEDETFIPEGIPVGIAPGVLTNRTWMFDGRAWVEKAEMRIAREKHACSIVNMANGKVK